MTHHEGNDTGGGSPRETDLNELSWGSTFWHQDLATPNNLQARAESLRPNNNQDRTQPITENRMLKVILNSQPPQNIAFDIALHTRGIRPSSTHQRVGTSPSYTGPWINLTHQGAEARSKRNYDPAACGEERPKTQEVKRQNET